MSPIEWTDETWNPTVGCSRVSPGCDNCYAEKVAARGMQDAHRGLTEGGKWTGEVRCLPDRLDTPLRWRKPRRVFVDSMSDLFHPDVPIEFVAKVWNVMAQTPQHTYQVLTKRPQRMAEMLGAVRRCEMGWLTHDGTDPYGGEHGIVFSDQLGWPLPNVWLGVSVENQRYADLRIPHLLATPAAVRFLSIEPLLGPVDLRAHLAHRVVGVEGCARAAAIDWVIVGGESGPGARPMHPQWARDLRDQCTAAGVPFFFKQWGEWVPEGHPAFVSAYGVDPDPDDPRWQSVERTDPITTYEPMFRAGKKAAGRELDGRTWDEQPGGAGTVPGDCP